MVRRNTPMLLPVVESAGLWAPRAGLEFGAMEILDRIAEEGEKLIGSYQRPAKADPFYDWHAADPRRGGGQRPPTEGKPPPGPHESLDAFLAQYMTHHERHTRDLDRLGDEHRREREVPIEPTVDYYAGTTEEAA